MFQNEKSKNLKILEEKDKFTIIGGYLNTNPSNY